MSPGIIRFILATTTVLALVAVPPCFAQNGLCHVERKPGAHALNEVTWKRLNAIYEDVGEERYDEAHEDLQKMQRRAGRDKYLQAVLNQALAQVEWSRENFDASLGYFEKAVELDVLPDATHFALMYQIAQLYFMQDRYDEALQKLELWFCKVPVENVTSAAYVLQASIYAQKEDYPGAIKAIEPAIAMDDDPEESWYQLKLAAHYELEQYPQAAETLEIMISKWPARKMYWTQLSQIYLKLNQDEKALAIQALAYRNDLLDSHSDITYLSSLYSNSAVPYRAAKVLQKGILDGIVPSDKNNWTLVADAWYAAEELENALAAYEEAGKAAEDGNIDLRRAYILVDLERWRSALKALDLALEKGVVNQRKKGEAFLLRGMTNFNLNDFDSASADWDRAGRYEKSREAARQWKNHMHEERLRREA